MKRPMRNQPGNFALSHIMRVQQAKAGGAPGPDRARRVQPGTHGVIRIGKTDAKPGPGPQWTAGGFNCPVRRAPLKNEGKAL